MYLFFNCENNNNMKKILFTGARSGIAKDVIDNLLNKDYYIYATTHTKEEAIRLKEEYRNLKNIECLKLDITKENDRNILYNFDLDIIVLNAAIGYGGSLIELPIDRIRENYEVNFFSNIQIIQIVLAQMIKKKEGKIIIISSIAGILPIEFMGSYCSTKASLIMLAKILRKELKLLKSNIKIKLIEPGVYKTGFNEIMRENKKEYIKSFDKSKEKIKIKESLMFDLLGRKDLSSISSEIIKAITDNNNIFIYSSPISTKIFAKLYQFIKD